MPVASPPSARMSQHALDANLINSNFQHDPRQQGWVCNDWSLTILATGSGVHQRLYFSGAWFRAVLSSPQFIVRRLIIFASPQSPVEPRPLASRPGAFPELASPTTTAASQPGKPVWHRGEAPPITNRTRLSCVVLGVPPPPLAGLPRMSVTIKPSVPNRVQPGKRTAKRAVGRQQAAIRSMIFIGRFGHGTKGFKFLVQFYRRYNIIAHVVGDMRNQLFCFHQTDFSPVS